MLRWRSPSSAQSRLSIFIHAGYLLLFFSVLFAALYRRLILDSRDPFKCTALITDGHWLDALVDSQIQRPLQNWQPPGCMLHKYNKKDISTCFSSRRIVLFGDSTIRQIYWAIATKLDPKVTKAQIGLAEKHSDQSLNIENINIVFIWDPYLNSTKLYKELLSYRENLDPARGGFNESDRASLILIGGGLWHAKYIEVDPVKYFKESIDGVVAYMPSHTQAALESDPQASILTTRDRDLILLAPVQVPMYEALSWDRMTTITPAKVDLMNDYLHQKSANEGKEVLWSYELMTWRQSAAYEPNGLHVIESVASARADILLNLRCNAKAAARGNYPFDRTCCSMYSLINRVQWTILWGGLWVLPVVSMLVMKDTRRQPLLPSRKILRAILIVTLAMCYSFFADRTQIFNKAQKQFITREFETLCWIIVVLGILTLRRSAVSRTSKVNTIDRRPDQPFLSRDQSEEWKGWMQFIILIYHYTGASKVLWIYEVIRVLVASYLFMTGFGHTVYFYTKDDYSFRRFASVLVRLNMLSCLLPYIMRTDYLFYYFAPLVTYWFVVIYFTMRIGHSRNGSLMFLTSKLLVSAALTVVMNRTPGILEAIFSTLRYTCRIDWNVTEWRFRVSLDMYIVHTGMLAAILYTRIADAMHAKTGHPLFVHIRQHFRTFHITSVVISVGLLPLFWMLVRNFPDKFSYNAMHPYISHLPILTYLVLRNSHRNLRNFHSSIFAWLGRCSLETFTLQFHIWLAGDTKGLLSIGLFNHAADRWRLADFILLTIAFLWISWHVSAATGTLTSWIIDPKAGRAEVEIDDRDVGAASGLPRTKSYETLLPKDFDKASDQNYLRKWISAPLKVVKDDLPVRVLLILGVMWLLNWV